MDFSRPLIMGILNVTPDSFSDGGLFNTVEKAVSRAKEMIAHGADIIDVGGESTKPGSDEVSVEEELSRVVPVVRELVSLGFCVSIDSMKPAVVSKCLELGVKMVNDVSGLRNPEMVSVVAKYDVPVVIMHMLGMPKTMQQEIKYGDVVEEVKDYLFNQALKAKRGGVHQVIVDPGIGFGKTVSQNFQLIKELDKIVSLGYPVLMGVSRKSFLGGEVKDRLEGTLAAVTACVLNGAKILRVHDVKECKKAVEIAWEIYKSSSSG